MIDFRDLNTFYDELERKYFRLRRDDFVNVKIDNVIEYASEEKNFGNVVNMVEQKNSYLPFEKCLIYGLYSDAINGEIMIYFVCFRVKRENTEFMKASEFIKATGKIVTEIDQEDVELYHGKHGIQLIDMFIAKDGGNLIYTEGLVETFYNDFKRMNSIKISDADVDLLIDENERAAMFVHYYTSLEFFHSRNVRIVNNEIPIKLKKAQIKRNGRAKLETSTVKVFPYIYSKDKEKREISFEDFSSRNEAHFTRGHFRTYTEQAPLFGKYTGTYFIAPHWRGKGEQMKDYELIAER